MPTNLGETTLRWMAEVGSGSIRDLRTRLEGLARARQKNPAREDSGRWLRDIASLGHVELDWDDDCWAAAPLVLTRLPGTDGLALLTGPRTAAVHAALDDLEATAEAVAQPQVSARIELPSSLLLQYDSPQQLQEAATVLGASYVPCAARQLASLLPPLALGEAAAPPRNGEDSLERYSPLTLNWQRASTTAAGPGLYRLDHLGRKRHLYREQLQWRHCDLPTGVFTALAHARVPAMRWRGETGRGRESYGQLFTDWGAPLPALHQRALVLCSGLVPHFSGGARTSTYVNVPRSLATAVAVSLSQSLTLA